MCRGGTRQSFFDFGKPAKVEVGVTEANVRVYVTGIEPHRDFSFFDRFLILAGALACKPCPQSVSYHIARISLRPRCGYLLLLFKVTRDLPVVVERDVELFRFTGAVPQLVGLSRTRCGE